MSNATRGVLAEYIVARALGLAADDICDEWAAYDLLTPTGIKIQVKSAAYIQSWTQSKLSTITFIVRKTRAWDVDTNLHALESQRQADVYVFALLSHTDKLTINPLDMTQWRFYVVPTEALNARTRSQHSITLKSLEKLCPEWVSFERLGQVVEKLGQAHFGNGSQVEQ